MRVEALRDKAEGMLKAGDEFAFAMDSSTLNGKVLVALALPKCSGVFEIDKTEFGIADAERLAHLLGFPMNLTAAKRVTS